MAEQMSIFDAAMKYAEDKHSAGHSRWSRVWQRFIARLGSEGNAFVRCEGSGRREFRTDSSLKSCRHGRVAVAISRGNNGAIARDSTARKFFDHRAVGLNQAWTKA